jgi:predicted alpha/beta-hydrolase family hydrolase
MDLTSLGAVGYRADNLRCSSLVWGESDRDRAEKTAGPTRDERGQSHRYKRVPGVNALLVLAHGAGAGQQHPFMTTVANGFAARGIDVVTFDFPYVRERRKTPDRAPVLEKAFQDVVVAARQWSAAARFFIGGKSMGGRMATHLGAGQLAGLRGIIVFGYPLHPPGKPDQLRVEHLPSITAPVFIVQGERDTFGTPGELRPAVDSMKAAVELQIVPRGDHSLAVAGRRRDDVLNEVLDKATAWMRDLGSDPFTRLHE